MKTYFGGKFDVVVIGAGHAGCEAALASARLGMKTLVATMSLESIAMMPCNPNVGGTATGEYDVVLKLADDENYFLCATDNNIKWIDVRSNCVIYSAEDLCVHPQMLSKDIYLFTKLQNSLQIHSIYHK